MRQHAPADTPPATTRDATAESYAAAQGASEHSPQHSSTSASRQTTPHGVVFCGSREPNSANRQPTIHVPRARFRPTQRAKDLQGTTKSTSRAPSCGRWHQTTPRELHLRVHDPPAMLRPRPESAPSRQSLETETPVYSAATDASQHPQSGCSSMKSHGLRCRSGRAPTPSRPSLKPHPTCLGAADAANQRSPGPISLSPSPGLGCGVVHEPPPANPTLKPHSMG